MEFREAAEREERPVLSYEEDSGRLLLNFNAVLLQKFRKLQDIVIITEGGFVQGLTLTSAPMGPEERLRYEIYLKNQAKGAEG